MKRMEHVKVAGHTFVAELPTRMLEGQLVVDFKVLEAFELAVARKLADSGESAGEAFRFMRKAIGLPATELAELLGVARETISRWENGERPVDRGALAVLGGLVEDRCNGTTSTRDRLQAIAKPPKLAKTVEVAVPRPAVAGSTGCDD
jgi:DNA-binding transcriptional regulator YiaG